MTTHEESYSEKIKQWYNEHLGGFMDSLELVISSLPEELDRLCVEERESHFQHQFANWSDQEEKMKYESTRRERLLKIHKISELIDKHSVEGRKFDCLEIIELFEKAEIPSEVSYSMVRDSNGTMLVYGANKGQLPEIILKLPKIGWNFKDQIYPLLNVGDPEGGTVVMHASYCGQLPEVIDAMYSVGEKENASSLIPISLGIKDVNKQTAMSFAICNEQTLKVMEALHRSNVPARDMRKLMNQKVLDEGESITLMDLCRREEGKNVTLRVQRFIASVEREEKRKIFRVVDKDNFGRNL